MSIKYILSCVHLTLLLPFISVCQQHDFFLCNETCNAPISFDTIQLKYQTYIGDNTDKIKFKDIEHVIRPSVFIWVPRFSNSASFSSSQNLTGKCFTREEYVEEKVVFIEVPKRPKKIPDSDLKYVSYDKLILNTNKVDCEALCGWRESDEFMIELMMALKEVGISTKYISDVRFQSQEISTAVSAFQQLNGLNSGFLTVEVLEMLGMDVKKYL